MKISVIIPAYNAAKSIEKALLSVRRQTFAPHEIIVVSDGSTDETEPLIQKGFPEARLIPLSENKGVSFARNEGIRQATGDWMAFLDADDEWHPEKLEILAHFIEKVPGAGGFIHLFSTDKNDKPFAGRSENKIAQKVSFLSLLLQNKAQGSSIAIKAEKKYFFNPAFRYCEDHELALRIAWEKQLFLIPLELTRLGREQLSAGGLSGHRSAMRKAEIKLYSSVWKFHPFFILFVPLLLLFSLLKHGIKKIRISGKGK